MEIFVTKACIYKEGRCHGVFNDESSIILHEGGHYCTYFSPKGEITRQVTVCAVGGVKSKLLKLIKLFNSSYFVPIPTFADEIYKVFSREIKILSSAWQSPSLLTVICNSKEVKTIKYKENEENNESIGIVEQDSKGSLKYKSIDNEVSVALNSNGLLFKVTYPYLLPNRKPNYNEGVHNRIRLTYEYASISQVFSVFDFPKQWAPALSILLAAAGKEFITHEENEFTIPLPTSEKGSIWNNDTVSPAVNIFCYYNPLYLYWQPDASFYVLSLTSSIVFIHEDRSVLECESSFFTHYRLDNTLKFTFDTIPIHVRNASYSLQNIANICKEFQSIVVKTENKAEFVEEEMLDGIKFENEVEELGSFIAYNDKSIRVLFNDRTLIRIYSDFTVSAISRSGEAAKFNLENPYGFESYIPVCVEFYNWAFMSQADQIKRANEALERENIVMAEINRVERLNNKIPQSPVVVDENIAMTLMNTKKQIEETQELLRKIHNIKK